MGEDWRVSLALHNWRGGHRKSVVDRLAGILRDRFGNGIRVTSDEAAGARDFIWCYTVDAALEAEWVARSVLAELGVGADCWLQRWNPADREWQDAPFATASDAYTAWARRQEEDRSKSAATGFAAWNVRVELRSHHDVVALTKRLRSEGWPVVRRRKYLLAGADCEADLGRLVPQIQATTNADAHVIVGRSERWAPPIWM